MSAALALMLAAAVFVPIPGPGGRGVGYVDGGSSLAATAYVEVSGKGEDRVVSAQMRKVPFRDVVRLLARGWSGQVTLSDSVPNPKIDLDLTNARVESALRAAVQRASREHPGLTFGRNNELFFIYIPAEAGKPPPPGAPTGRLEPEAPRHITRELQAEPLHRAIERVFEGTGAEFLINTDVPDAPVTASIQDLTLREALRLLIQRAAVPGLQVRWDGRVYRFSINQSLADQIRAAQQLDLHGEGAGARISVDFHDTGLRDALQTVFKASAFQYVLGQNVPNVPVTLQLKDLTVPQTLRLLVKQAAAHVPGLTLSRDGGVWLIRIPAVISEPRDEPPAPESESFGVELQWEKIPLHYLSVRTIIRLSGGGLVEDLPVKAAQHGQSGAIPSPLGNQKLPAGAEASVVAAIPPGITNLLGVVADNTLIVRGTPDDVNALKDLLHLLDLPRRQLRIRFTMGSLSAEGIAFNLASATISHGDAATALNLTAAPHLLGDGNIDLTVSGSIRTSGRSRPVRVQARIVPGKTTRLLMVATGKHASELRVRVDALSDPPPSELPRQ